jgi:tetratricopeptide (TPR) repeat protein
MGLMDKVSGNDEGAANGADETTRVEAPVEVAEIAAAPVDSAAAAEGEGPEPPKDGIRAFDQNGQEVIVPREEWRANVLPTMIREVWDQPDQLYLLVLNSMNDGFFTEIADAARHLYETDSVPARGACMWGITLIQTGRVDEAETVLSTFVQEKGEDASVLTNLAKVYAAKGQHEQAEKTLWRALELEPNLDNGLGWYATMEQERGGDEAATAALERIRTMPASWRAQLWLARAALNAKQLEEAKALYTEALERAPKPVPGDLLMQMSGDFGGHGLLRELLEFTAPHFVPEVHGLPVGNNLIKACIDTGNLEPAAAIVADLVRFQRPDWQGALAFWSNEIARVRGGGQQELQIWMLRVDGPVWLPAASRARKLFGNKAPGGPTVTFLGGTAEAPPPAEGQQPVMDEALGRFTRSLPLFLAEQVEMLGKASGRAMVPWAVSQGQGQPSGFVVSGQKWPDAVAVQSVSGDPNQSDYVVTVHVDAEVEPWTADLAFVRSSDGVRIGELTEEFDRENPEEGIRTLAAEMLELLGGQQWIGSQVVYEVPAGQHFGSYLTRLEQLLSVRCAGMEGVPATFLTGESTILDGNLELCRAEPHSTVARVLTVETLAAMRAVRPEVAAEFLPKLQALEAEKPLPEVAAAFG